MSAPNMSDPVQWSVKRACENRGCQRTVLEYRDPLTGDRLAIHEDDRTSEADCSAAPFDPTDADVRNSTDPAFLRRILSARRVALRQAMLALANPACPADVLTDYRERNPRVPFTI